MNKGRTEYKSVTAIQQAGHTSGNNSDRAGMLDLKQEIKKQA